MTKVILPRLNQVGTNEWADVQTNDEAIANVVNGELDNSNLTSNAEIARAKLAPEARGIPGQWYTPKVIATEESRTNTAYGTLTTADEITNVVLPENGLIFVGYQAAWKSSVGEVGSAAIFLNSNQLAIAEVDLGGTSGQRAGSGAAGKFFSMFSHGGGLAGTNLAAGADYTGDVTTGQILGATAMGSGVIRSWNESTVSGIEKAALGGPVCIFAAAGTYAISIRFKSSSGSVTAKNRKLWVWTVGV